MLSKNSLFSDDSVSNHGFDEYLIRARTTSRLDASIEEAKENLRNTLIRAVDQNAGGQGKVIKVRSAGPSK
ncbi:hypothetical protein SAMN04488518_113125 [Pseudovibrio ascidiaceicola]|uniref:Uncharacterized protein n=1 Tax=Pseudovibrio ascidiaceicola TaxID=285279 RepID=A0A1I4E0Z7_9HYPH|nr:hypothetical protein [Pseudovibrio ascidiaceicola]SFK99524.1 hypothetical protein SAMN04488518_113125 [Pseudovibrio ascidiaceicola]